jgi:hypothetical protein
MTTLLCYSRNRSTSVEQIDDETLVSTCTLHDTLTEAFVRIHIRFPELKILQAEGEFIRSDRGECIRIAEALKKIKGVRIGAGMKKIVRGLTGEVTTCRELPLLIEEACHGVILAFTKDALALAPKGVTPSTEFFRKMVQENIRLYNRCAAFAPPSPLVEGLEI